MAPDWSAAVEEQVIGRAFRLSQLQDVTVYRILAYSSVEECMRKQKLERAKEFGLLDVLEVDVATLDDEGRIMVEATKAKIKDMQNWTNRDFLIEVSLGMF